MSSHGLSIFLETAIPTMVIPKTRENEWGNGLTRLRELGAPIPDDASVGGTFTHADSMGRNVREIGGWWLEPRDAQSAELITWLLAATEIDNEALSDQERYVANMVAIRQLINRITVIRSGQVIDATSHNNKLRALHKTLQKRQHN